MKVEIIVGSDLALQVSCPGLLATTTMSGISLLPFIVVFLILFTLAFGIIVAVIIAQYLKERKGNRIRPKVSCKQRELFCQPQHDYFFADDIVDFGTRPKKVFGKKSAFN